MLECPSLYVAIYSFEEQFPSKSSKAFHRRKSEFVQKNSLRLSKFGLTEKSSKARRNSDAVRTKQTPDSPRSGLKLKS